ncbi:hypothetical protein HAX54_016660, partial [Datura stramonium]|nr:hypothetical protein [Datura stramonium]
TLESRVQAEWSRVVVGLYESYREDRGKRFERVMRDGEKPSLSRPMVGWYQLWYVLVTGSPEDIR